MAYVFKALLSLIIIMSSFIWSDKSQQTNRSDDDYMSQIKKVREELKSKKPIPIDNYLDSVQISYGRNRQPNVVSYGLTSPSFSNDTANNPSAANSLSEIGNYTSLIELEIWSKLEQKDAFIDSVFAVRLLQSDSTSVKIMKTQDMMNFKEFPKKTSDSVKLEICNDHEENMVNKVYVAFFCQQNERSVVEFELKHNSSHSPLKFFMRKVCNRGKIPELNVLMTTNQSNAKYKNYDQKVIYKSSLTPFEQLPVVFAENVYFYISSEIGRQILIYPKITTNESDVQAYLSGNGTFGGIISCDKYLDFEVIFTCESMKTVNVTYTALVPPFDDVQFSFLKKCSNNFKDYQSETNVGLVIGTQYGEKDVFENGKTSPEFSIEDYTDNTNIKIVDTLEDTSVFYISSKKRLILKEIKAFATDKDRMKPMIIGNLNDKAFNHFLVSYNCQSNGDSFVRIVLDFENHKVVQFNVLKQCLVHPSHSEGHGNTFIKYFWVVIGLVTLICFMVYFVDKCGKVLINERKNQHRYQESSLELSRPQIIFN